MAHRHIERPLSFSREDSDPPAAVGVTAGEGFGEAEGAGTGVEVGVAVGEGEEAAGEGVGLGAGDGSSTGGRTLALTAPLLLMLPGGEKKQTMILQRLV